MWGKTNVSARLCDREKLGTKKAKFTLLHLIIIRSLQDLLKRCMPINMLI